LDFQPIKASWLPRWIDIQPGSCFLSAFLSHCTNYLLPYTNYLFFFLLFLTSLIHVFFTAVSFYFLLIFPRILFLSWHIKAIHERLQSPPESHIQKYLWYRFSSHKLTILTVHKMFGDNLSTVFLLSNPFKRSHTYVFGAKLATVVHRIYSRKVSRKGELIRCVLWPPT